MVSQVDRIKKWYEGVSFRFGRFFDKTVSSYTAVVWDLNEDDFSVQVGQMFEEKQRSSDQRVHFRIFFGLKPLQRYFQIRKNKDGTVQRCKRLVYAFSSIVLMFSTDGRVKVAGCVLMRYAAETRSGDLDPSTKQHTQFMSSSVISVHSGLSLSVISQSQQSRNFFFKVYKV